MNDSNLIHVQLFGSGSRDSRLRAEYVYCDCAEQCSAFKDGKCYRTGSGLFSPRCKCGKTVSVDGGEKRSKKYGEVYTAAKNDDKYQKLNYPSNSSIIRIGDKAQIVLPNIDITIDNGKLVVKDLVFITPQSVLIDKELLTPDNLARICSFLPSTMFGDGVYYGYRDKIIPHFLFQLSKLFPKEYDSFVQSYTEYADLAPDFRKMRAKLNTLDRSYPVVDDRGNVFNFEGEYLVCENYKNALLPFESYETYIKIKITDKMTARITDNRQVTSDTVLV